MRMALLSGLFTWWLSFGLSGAAGAQSNFPHARAHAHNDYEHARPLKDALKYGFTSVEADVHLHKGRLRVGHNSVTKNSPELEVAYLSPLDSLVKRNRGGVYGSYKGIFYLMIDIKTEAVSTYKEIRQLLAKYPGLLCTTDDCPVKIFLSGNRPIEMMLEEGYQGIALDGRPDDLGKNYPVRMIPVVSDNFNKWSSWNGKGTPKDFDRITDLAKRVHQEGRLLRLWAIPDNNAAWQALLDAGVDLINSDRLEELHQFFDSGAGKK